MTKEREPFIRLAYGKTGLDVAVPSDATVLEPRYLPGLSDEPAALVQALREPINSPSLGQLAHPGQRVAIVHTDITRATPNDRILPPLLQELESAGIRREDITLINALGTHRPQTPEELRTMLGAQIVANYRCLQHNGNDEANLVPLGTTRFGHRIRINRQFVEADLRILTGFIEPHFFAGFSGGPKGVLPSIAGAESVLDNHGARMIADPKATWGVTAGNPIWEEMLEAATMTRPNFILNVALNRDRRITGVFAGELRAAHARGCEFVRAAAMVPVDEPFDVVVTSASGYPLDLNLYQTVKGMSAAAQIVRPGGGIIAAASCWDGIPEHGPFGRLLRELKTPAEALARIEKGVRDLLPERPEGCFAQEDPDPFLPSMDQWQVQTLAHILLKAEVYVRCDGLSEEQLRACMVQPCRRIEDTLADLRKRAGRRLSLCVLPEGPLTIPYLK